MTVERFLQDNPVSSVSMFAIDQDGTCAVRQTENLTALAIPLALRPELSLFRQRLQDLNTVAWGVKNQRLVN